MIDKMSLKMLLIAGHRLEFSISRDEIKSLIITNKILTNGSQDIASRKIHSEHIEAQKWTVVASERALLHEIPSDRRCEIIDNEHVNCEIKTRKFSFTAKKPTETPLAGPQLLSKLFPQTAVIDEAQLEAEQEKKKKEEEGKRLMSSSSCSK